MNPVLRVLVVEDSDNAVALMPRLSSLAAVALLRHRELDPPFVVVSGTINEEIAVTILNAGAHDFVRTAAAAGLPSVWISSCHQDVGTAAVDPVDADPSAPFLVALVRRTRRIRTVATRTRSHWPAS